MDWRHKDLLEISQLSREEIGYVCETAARFAEVNQRPIKKVPILKGKSVVLFFAEASTRTKTSFDMAGKRLSADTFSLAKSGSSLQKGESLKDTALTLQAMNPDAIVIRHWDSGAARFLAERLISLPDLAQPLGRIFVVGRSRAVHDRFRLLTSLGDDPVGL